MQPKGCGQPVSVDANIIGTSNSKANRKRKFSLVCDPTYMTTRGPLPDGGPFEPIYIGYAQEVLKGNRSTTYDLCWDVLAASLPSGRVRFSLSGRDVKRLATNADSPKMANRDTIIMYLHCRKVDQDDQEMLDDPDNKQWKLKLMTDPASKFLVIEQEDAL
ncbi:hypothetical protein M426DRAFT_320388 [Hypoxylon sp. CI-4A]|nr:hypothetical protein M426DRAFT_320388 [Hypoxylon sp. CI-4A]